MKSEVRSARRTAGKTRGSLAATPRATTPDRIDRRERASSMQAARMDVGGSTLAIVLVDSADTLPERGPATLARLQPHFPALPIMLVSIEDNGFRAFATFQTSELLALVQLEHVNFVEIDPDADPAQAETLPF